MVRQTCLCSKLSVFLGRCVYVYSGCPLIIIVVNNRFSAAAASSLFLDSENTPKIVSPYSICAPEQFVPFS